MQYLIVIEKTATGYSAYSPDLDGCVATGATKQEIEQNMWPISLNVPTQFQRRDPPDFTEGTHPISGGPLRFLS